ncbi:MAG: hypothetical protein JOS17DRAFT_318099 [Linnemannia elongata]|nr:MAG: hypothetical protein JOS17DRAFT_318099 [Linnemannia elongata]
MCKCKPSSPIDGGGIRLVFVVVDFFTVCFFFTFLFFFSLPFTSTPTLPYHKLVCLCNLLSFLFSFTFYPFLSLFPLLSIVFNHSRSHHLLPSLPFIIILLLFFLSYFLACTQHPALSIHSHCKHARTTKKK